MTAPAFLRGRLVELRPGPAPESDLEWLAPPDARGFDVRFALHPPGALALRAVDWAAREAWVELAWALPPPPGAAEDALAAAARYAFDELDLARLRARPARAEAARALRAAGYAEGSAGWVVARRPPEDL